MRRVKSRRIEERTSDGVLREGTELTFRELLQWGCRELDSVKIENSETDARILLEHAFKMSREQYLLRANEPAPEPGMTEDGNGEKKVSPTEYYLSLIRHRKSHIPVQYLTNVQNFMGYDFFVTEDVLIPRQDTEVLAETVWNAFRKMPEPPLSLLDLCTGSGCLAISLAKMCGFSEIVATDLSDRALRIATFNGKKILDEQERKRISFCQGDLFEAVPAGKTFDMIVSNPPYVTEEEMKELQPEVGQHEPEMALFAPENGLYFYRRISQRAGEFLKPGGMIFFEIGCSQADAVSGLLESNGFKAVFVQKDLAGLDRVVGATWP